MRPVIGVTLDFNRTEEYAKTPWYALRENYITALSDLGAKVLLLHYEYGAPEEIIKELDGLVITGGNFDVDPNLYGETISHERVNPNQKRTNFEFGVCRAAIDSKTPLFGICGGEQLMNVVMGGSLIQHIPAEIDNYIEHEQKIAKHLPSHKVMVSEGSMLYDIVGAREIDVNTTHHQAVKTVGNGLQVCGVAPDGVIEAIESIDKSWFCLGVQWHPEYNHIESDKRILKAFVGGCVAKSV